MKCLLGNYLLCIMLIFSNIFTAYFIYPFIVNFFYNYADPNSNEKLAPEMMGVYIGIIIGSYDMCRLLSSGIWGKIADITGLSLSISLSLIFLTVLNCVFASVETLGEVIVLRVLLGIANNLPQFSKSSLLEIFPLKAHPKMIQIFSVFQSISIGLLFLMTYLGNIISNGKNIFTLLTLIIASINVITLALYFIKFRCKYFIPTKRNECYMHNFPLGFNSERQDGNSFSNNQEQKSMSNSVQKLKNPNKEGIIKAVNLDLFSSHNKSPQKQQEEFMSKRNNKFKDTDQNDTDISNSFQKIEMAGKKEGMKGNIENNNSILQAKVVCNCTKDEEKVNHHNTSTQLDVKCEEKKFPSENRNVNISKNYTERKKKMIDKQIVISPSLIQSLQKSNNDFRQSRVPHRKFSTSTLGDDNPNLDKVMIKKSTGPISIFMISSIFTSLQVCETLGFDVYFLKVLFTASHRGLELSLLSISWILSLYYLISGLIFPLANFFVAKYGVMSDHTNKIMYYVFLSLGLIFSLTFGIMEEFFIQDFNLALYLIGILLLRNICLSSALTCYNVGVLHLPDISSKESIIFHQGFTSLIIRDLFTVSGCCLYSYISWMSLFAVLYLIPLISLILSIWLGKKFLFSLNNIDLH